MKPDLSERILVEELFKKSINSKRLNDTTIENVEKLTGDASTRKYYRVFTTSPEKTFVVCLDNPLSADEPEPTFIEIQKILEKEKVRVPKIYDQELTTGYILEEDLGDITYLKEISQINNKDQEYNYYFAAVELMNNIHSVNVAKYPNATFNKLAFDFEKLNFEMEFTKKYFLQQYLGVETEVNNDVKILMKKLQDVCIKLSLEKRVLVHRDYHSRNLMMINNQPVVIDFQDARMGTPLYDLTSLLEDCYYQLDYNNKEKLKKEYYINFYKKIDSSKSEDEFNYMYDLMALQRVYKAIGSFAYIYAGRKDLRYLRHIGFAFENVRRILFKYPEFNEVRKILSNMYYGN